VGFFGKPRMRFSILPESISSHKVQALYISSLSMSSKFSAFPSAFCFAIMGIHEYF